MDINKRIEKLDKCNNLLRSVALILADANDIRSPSARICSAISNINRAVSALGQEIITLEKK